LRKMKEIWKKIKEFGKNKGILKKWREFGKK
jgi:hypothetical protein